ncbi:MAG: hypothetical protein HY562_05920 [Ignavibacteriales bacterium]|nr:hypothetical protein [Ignavibacteriales bacterium]
MNEFYFNTKLDQTLLLGTKARSVAELLNGIKSAPESSIYYHTHRYLQQHHFLSPEPPNDFAYWIQEVLNEPRLGELMYSVDVVQFNSLEDLRNKFIEILEQHSTGNGKGQTAPEGQEFHFMASQTFVLRTPYVANDLKQFAEILRKISVNSLYYHIFDAKLRLEKGENDFSRWFRDLGKTALADEVVRLDPYTHTLEGLRARILQLVQQHDKN